MSTRIFLFLASLLLAGSAAATVPTLGTLSQAVAPSAGFVGEPTAGNAVALPLTREQFLSSISRELVTHFRLEGDLDLELIRSWSIPSQVAQQWTITVLEFPNVPASSMMLRCRILADGVVVAEPTLVFRASLWRDAWATRSPLTTGAMFDAAMLETRRVDLFRDRDALPASVGDRSYIFARGVPSGYLLTWHDIARRPLVRRGDMVEVSAVEGSLVVTMKGLAMENGAQGELITIRNPDSRKDFSAVVVDENRVQVRF